MCRVMEVWIESGRREERWRVQEKTVGIRGHLGEWCGNLGQ